MDKKGFTLTELLGVIAILAMLITIGTATYINVRDNMLQKDYDNLVNYLETKAAEYASKNNVTTITVDDLIKEGYVKADDDIFLYNPINKEKLNCYVIKSKLNESGEYESVFEKDNNLGFSSSSDGCNSYTRTTDYKICIYKGSVCEDISNDVWQHLENATFGVKLHDDSGVITDSHGYNITWRSTSGLTSTGIKAKLAFSDGIVAQYTLSVTVEKDGTVGNGALRLRIDNEKPSLISKEYIKEWTNHDKKVTIKVSDNFGSGIKGVYIGTSSCSKSLTYNAVTNGLYETNLGIGTYNLCVIDNADNLSIYENEFDIEKIDKIAPEISVANKTLSFAIGSSYNLVSNVTINDDEDGSGVLSTKISYDDGSIKREISNISSLGAGVYTIIYEARDIAGNITKNDETKLTIFVPKSEIKETGKDIEYIIPVSGTYKITLQGAQGGGNGGKGGKIIVTAEFTKDQKLVFRLGDTSGGNGGGAATFYTYNGSKTTYAGGGATTVKLNGSYLVRAAGGGGGSGGTAGGNGTGAGGGSGSNAGNSGTNSGGGASGKDYSYDCNCSTCGGGCAEYESTKTCDTCGGACISHYTPYCISWGSGPFVGCSLTCDNCCCLEYSYCDGWCPPCSKYEPTYDCNCKVTGKTCVDWYPTYTCCDTCSATGAGGKGGSNYYDSSKVTLVGQSNGVKAGDGDALIEYIP